MFPTLLMAGARPIELRSYNTTTAIPADAAEGDLLFHTEVGRESATSPSAWAMLTSGSAKNGFLTYAAGIACKRAEAGDGGTSFAMTEQTYTAATLAFDTGGATPVVGEVVQYSTTGNPTALTLSSVNMSSRCIVLALYGSTSSSSAASRVFTVGGVTNAYDGEVLTSQAHVVLYKVFDPSTPKEDVVIDMGDHGTNFLHGAIINLT